MSPGDFISALYRRGGTLLLVARRPLRGREGQSGLQNPCADEDGQWRKGVSTDGQSTKLPYRVVGEIKIPGVMSDTSLGFVIHIAEVLRRTSMRHGVMARLPRITWGLEAQLLQSTHAALPTSLTSYGLAVVGSGAYAKALEKMGARGADFAARRRTGISRSARLETSYMTAGVWSKRNQYLQNVALLFPSVLEATACSPTTRAREWLEAAYAVTGRSGFRGYQRFFRPDALRRRTIVRGAQECEVCEKWYHFPLGVSPVLGERHRVESVCHANKHIPHESPEMRPGCYSFEELENWQKAG